MRRLHWGCGDDCRAGWINSDLRPAPGVDLAGDILDGLALETDSIDYATSQHALQQLPVLEIPRALAELRRVLRPGGTLRMCLPDLDRAIDAYREGRREYFWCWDWKGPSGNLITQIMDYGYTRTPVTYEFVAELSTAAGFREVHRLEYRRTRSPHTDIVEIDTRPDESFFLEAVK